MSMTMTKKVEQKSVAVAPDIAAQWEEFVRRYPRASFTEVTNAALRLYFMRAQDGVDGNLTPLQDLDPS